MQELETAFNKVEEIKKELSPAEATLQAQRDKAWRLLGVPSYGTISFGNIIFSRLMIGVFAGFVGATLGTLFLGPLAAICLTFVGLGLGAAWIKRSL